MKFGLAGFYQIEKYKVDAEGNIIEGSQKVVLPWFQNHITNGGLDKMCSVSSDQLAYCRIGTGNSAPADGDTQLGAQVAASNAAGLGSTYGIGPSNAYVFRRVSRRFNAGTAAGVNLAEVGMGDSSTGGLFSRALLTDAEGASAVINLDPDEVLDVLYELRLYIPSGDVTASASIDGVPTTVTMRVAQNADNLNSWGSQLGRSMVITHTELWYQGFGHVLATIPAASSNFATGGTAGASITTSTYVPGSFRVEHVLSYGLSSGNVAGGIGCIRLANGGGDDGRRVSPFGYWMFGFNPPINKTAQRIATVTLGVQLARHSP